MNLLTEIENRFQDNKDALFKARFLLEKVIYLVRNPNCGGMEKALEDADSFLKYTKVESLIVKESC